MRSRPSLLLVLALVLAPLSLSALDDWTTSLIPHTVYVGDRARLVVTLPPGTETDLPLPYIQEEAVLPQGRDLKLLHLELSRSGPTLTVAIDLVAFTPGTMLLPPLNLGAIHLTGLEVSIASILTADASLPPNELAPPAPLLAAPGTAMVMYGSLFLLLALLLGALFFWRRFLPWYGALHARRERERVARELRDLLRLLSGELSQTSDERPGAEPSPWAPAYDRLCPPLRLYLSNRTGREWAALTPDEFGRHAAFFSSEEFFLLRSLFSDADAARFGGKPVDRLTVRREVEGIAALVDRIEVDGCVEGYGHADL